MICANKVDRQQAGIKKGVVGSATITGCWRDLMREMFVINVQVKTTV